MSVRTFRKAIETAFPVLGIGLIFGAILFVYEPLIMQVGLVFIGLLLLEMHAFRLNQRFLPSERRYTTLRGEVDHFIRIVRQVHRLGLALERDAGSPELKAAFEEGCNDLTGQAEKIAGLAGREDHITA